MKVIPLEDRVLIKTAELEEKTKSGLFIPQTAQEKTQVGVVTAVGSDKEAITVKVGQKIMYDKYAGTSIKVDGADYLIIKSKDILAVIED
ncbi:MAG: co-chaperone GroES [Spirochaetia bacterium]|nr:co-chaperone GroES [Spirochaetia bacterium]MBQ3647276.1 co-chaperone GroES [Spirochaetia bacterium]MBQ3713681.1 co-chaperone GroES [Spirochaetia bacterium]MBQ6673783.1 co-chaperone GroES [Spirochaetia bacterium]MBR0318294.1 co-chaperone GroES [Spirochaetia bacterium]